MANLATGKMSPGCNGSSDQSLMENPLSCISFQSVLHDCYNNVISCLWDGASKRVLHVVVVVDFISRYLSGPLPYV